MSWNEISKKDMKEALFTVNVNEMKSDQKSVELLSQQTVERVINHREYKL